MLLLTVKHVIADFVLQTSWMAHRQGPEARLGAAAAGALPVHLAVAMVLILIVAPRFWFVALIDFAIHITVDRVKGYLRRQFRRDAGKHPWFWTLIGVDQALHHLTGFGLSIFMASNG